MALKLTLSKEKSPYLVNHITHMSPFIYDGFTPANRTESPLTLPPPPSMMHMPSVVPPPPHIFSPAELKVQTVHHTLHYPVHNPSATTNWWPKPNYGPIRMNTNWNPHSLQSMMYTNHYAMTMNPYFMANPNSMMYANSMNMMPMNNMLQQSGNMPYNGDGFEQSYMSNGQEPAQNEEGGFAEGEGLESRMVI